MEHPLLRRMRSNSLRTVTTLCGSYAIGRASRCSGFMRRDKGESMNRDKTRTFHVKKAWHLFWMLLTNQHGVRMDEAKREHLMGGVRYHLRRSIRPGGDVK